VGGDVDACVAVDDAEVADATPANWSSTFLEGPSFFMVDG
jgi:hypothetical protein